LTERQLHKLRGSYHRYRKTVLQINNDLTFWSSSLVNRVEKYTEENSWREGFVYDSVFATYDIGLDGSGILMMMNERFSAGVGDLQNWAKGFNGRLTGLYVVREYNELELLLLGTANQKYFPKINYQPEVSFYKTIERKIRHQLREHGLEIESTNNRHILTFFKLKCHEYHLFLNAPVQGFDIRWEQFFEFISILRNSMANNRGAFTSKGMDKISEEYEILIRLLFRIYAEDDLNYILELQSENYHNFWNLINDFAANTIKVLANERTLDLSHSSQTDGDLGAYPFVYFYSFRQFRLSGNGISF